MLQGIRTVVISVAVASAVGAIFGLLVGALISDSLSEIGSIFGGFIEPRVAGYLIAAVAGAFLGSNFGLALAYGFLPESEADQPAEEPAEA